ncbi:hypothetical protein D6856_03515 [Butyrivibrio sp. XB500-5]|uniref:hypothetical protein n=1 Tax=Butyrivibrio sp. XB500-5 TaxID=2364880 RepID=UPI000EA8CDD5|nr:hypothetical protein [Butyrivibrio sp. XB500-5]RKM63204.1 hypothetical protein D6856_03515 [Butyrivibrio sp. XB500-5]
MIIAVKGISKAFNGQKNLDDFNINIEDEHSYILTGESGCSGKRTDSWPECGDSAVTIYQAMIEGW